MFRPCGARACQGVILVGSHGDAADGIHFAEGDFAIVDEPGDVGQGQEVDSRVAAIVASLCGGLVFE